jgi:hypothetical protein
MLRECGAASGVLSLLMKVNMVLRPPRAPIADVTRRALLEKWSSNYDVTRNNEARSFLQS